MKEEADHKFEEAFLVELVVVDIVDEINTNEVEASYGDQTKVVFPKVKEELNNFLNMCKMKDFKVMLCLCCSVVFKRRL